MKNGKLRVAVVGLRFGADFVPIWCKHPDVYAVDIVDVKASCLQNVRADNHGKNKAYLSLDEALKDDGIDAVHLVTPIPLHARQALQVLRSGKHCACTVPAACTLEELSEIVATQWDTGKNYMMMETAAYTFQMLHVEKMYKAGEIGRIQLMRGCHYQDMENWPSYWNGLPPMHYATHAIAPLLKLANARPTEVVCFGSGTMREELQKPYGNPFPAETALFKLENTPAVVELTRTLFETARAYCEGFCVYGSKTSFEWFFNDHSVFERFADDPDDGIVHWGRSCTMEKAESFPDTGDMLPPEIAGFTRTCGHLGSHPHLIHEFVRSILEGRPAAIDAVKAAQWTAAGICAHESAMKDGARIPIPSFE